KRYANQNLRTRFTKIIRRAGLTPWPKLFHNLRASCETDLAQSFPVHVVCSWIGNSQLIAAKHYLQVTESDFERAANSGAKPGAVGLQKAVQPASAITRRDSQESPQVETITTVGESPRIDVSHCDQTGWAMRESNPRLHGVSMA